jgi:BCD family chlorophyll transporter-like MFS transporter
MAFSGAIRDIVNAVEASISPVAAGTSSATGYLAVYGIEVGLLIVTVVVTAPLVRRAVGKQGGQPTPPTSQEVAA